MELNSLIKKINSEVNELPNYERLADIYSGNLVEYVKAELQKEMSANSFSVASQRIASVNLLERIINKLSKVYSDAPNRQTPDEKDQEQLSQYVQDIDVQDVMSQAEILLNMNKTFALEPYLDNGTFKVRVLAPYEFTVFSDDSKNPKNITHFIKFMGQTKSKSNKTVNIYWIYTNELFLIADSDATVLDSQVNPYGVIPFVYVNSSRFKLKPKPDNDSYNNSILIPKLLTDLNYAVQYQSHSIMYGIDVDANNLKGNPDSFWSIQSSEGENKKPQLGVLSPSVDVDKVLSLVTFTTSEWLNSKGIKPGSVGSMTPENAISGIAKLVDEADVSSVLQKNRIILSKAEQKLWKLIGLMHNYFLNTESLIATRGLSEPFNVSITFPLQKPIEDPKEKRDELEFKLKNKLTSYFRAVKEANPTLSDEEITILINEIKQESIQDSSKNNNQPLP